MAESLGKDAFLEIRPEDAPTLPRLVEVYVAQVEPQRCRTLLKVLSRDLPLVSPKERSLFDLTHLKRVKKSVEKNKEKDPQESPCKKKQKQGEDSISCEAASNKTKKKKSPPLLEVLLRDVESLEGEFGTQLMGKQQSNGSSIVEHLETTYELDSIVKRQVPGRPPESHQEWQEFQRDYWPTIFFPQRSQEYLDAQLELSTEEIQQMVLGMKQAIQDGSSTHPGAIILDPETGTVVACATDERKLQLKDDKLLLNNSLATSILMAIQGVSRIERTKATSAGMGSSEFQKGQYLCTGYDLYTTKEPTVFEAMSLVHSRIRRVVFGRAHSAGGLCNLHIHALPSTNHHYRAFQCAPLSEMGKQCKEIS